MISILPGEWKWSGRLVGQRHNLFPNYGNKGFYWVEHLHLWKMPVFGFSPGFVARIQVLLPGSRLCCQDPGFAASIQLVWMELVTDHWPATGSLEDLWDMFLSFLSSELIKILLIFLLAVVDGFRSVGMIKASVVF